jgi:8-oxo-dGTP diphosphatase
MAPVTARPAPPPGPAPLAAAGGLVWRPDLGRRFVCLVHRPRYDDWSLPKGSVKPGEHPLAAAVREVAEEAGLRGVPRLPLPATRYDVNGTPKVVEYWEMSAAGDQRFRPSSEVDRTAWLPVGEAVRRVRYRHDAGLLRHWDKLPQVTAVVLLVRHAHAGSRDSWPGPDHARPLSRQGIADAGRLAALLELFAPTRLVSASPDRCRQSVAPLATAQRPPVEVDQVFDERSSDPDAGAARIRELARDGGVTVVCTQGGVLSPVLSRLASDRPPPTAGAGTGPVRGRGDPGGAGRRLDWATDKGDGWLLSFAGPHLLAVAPLGAHRLGG